MEKRGNALLVLGFFFILFLLFLALKTFNIGNLTGYTTHEFGNGTNFTVLDINFARLNVTGNTSNLTFQILSDDEFYRFDNIGCIIDYNVTGDNYANVTVGFYHEDRNSSNPNHAFYDLLNDTSNNTVCQNESGDLTCVAYYNITESRLGDWSCFAAWDGRTNISNDMEMKNRAPILIQNISQINITVNGSYDNMTAIDLDNYFRDPDNDTLEYGAVGFFFINVSVNSQGVVSFSNPGNWSGYETILFRAYDGNIGTFSNNVSVRVGSGVTTQPLPACSPVWDCEWGNCVNGQQTCVYSDRNNCGNNTGKPADLTRECVVGAATGVSTGAQPPIDLSNLELEEIKVPKFTGPTRTLLIVGIVILVLVILGLGAYVLLGPKKGDTKEKNNQKAAQQAATGKIITGQTANIAELKKYIEAAMQRGQTEQKMQEALLKVGWQKRDIDNALNYVKLKKFVKDKLSAGFEKEKIVESLKAKGWKDDVINNIFKELSS